MKYSIIIDGYNLMYACGLAPDSPIGWQSARRLLVNKISKRIPQKHQPSTLVVFDSSLKTDWEDPSLKTSPIHVRFAINHESADAMIIDLIRKHSSPKKLTIVSSDHEIQTAALRRRSIAIDSDDWYFDHLAVQRDERQRPEIQNPKGREPRTQPPEDDLAKPTVPDLADAFEESWVDIFSVDSGAKRDDDDRDSDRGSENSGVTNEEAKKDISQNAINPDNDHLDISDEQLGESSKGIGDQNEDLKNWNPFPDDYLDELDDEPDY